jgi:biotin operon repressor
MSRLLAEKPMSEKMRRVYETIADAKTGQISGMSVATWLGMSRHPEGVRESLRALTNRGLIVMHPQDDPADEFRKAFPDRLKALYSITKRVTDRGGDI